MTLYVLSQAAEDVFAERRRQVEGEGYTADHDDRATRGQIGLAAAAYAIRGSDDRAQVDITLLVGGRRHHGGWSGLAELIWPVGWCYSMFKTGAGKRRNLVKAGALILAEIERLDRISPPLE